MLSFIRFSRGILVLLPVLFINPPTTDHYPSGDSIGSPGEKRPPHRISRKAYFIQLILRLLSHFPLFMIHAIGALIGRCLVLFPNKRRSSTYTNLTACFPGMPIPLRHRLARQSLIETGKTTVETGALWLWRRERVLAKVKQVTGEETLQQALAAGKGVILAFPHLGSWEMVNIYCSARYRVTCLYRPPPMVDMEDFVRLARQRLGARLVPTDRKGVRSLYDTLARGELVGILPDQDPSVGKGEFANFFGVQANTMTLLSRLANKTGAAVVFAYAERLPRGAGYHMHFLPAPSAIGGNDTAWSTTAVNHMVETCIGRLPEQYLWCYKRFRTRPAGEKGFYTR